MAEEIVSAGMKKGALAVAGLGAAYAGASQIGLPHDLARIRGLLPMLRITKNMYTKGRNVVQEWNDCVAKHGPKVAVIFENKRMTFDDMDRTSNQMASWLVQQGFTKGQCLALMMQNKPEFICWWLAMAKLGILVAMINFNVVQKGLVHCVKVAHCTGIVFDYETAQNVGEVAGDLTAEGVRLLWWGAGAPEVAAKLKPQNISMAAVTYDNLLVLPDTPPAASITADICLSDTFGYIYTSGTTGLPKAGVITHAKLLTMGLLFASQMRLTPDDIIYTCLPIFHSAGGGIGVGMMIMSGATMVLTRKFSASRYFEDCIKYKCTVVQYIGELCRYLVNYGKTLTPNELAAIRRNSCIRFAIGNGLRPEVWDDFMDLFGVPSVCEFYGATEGNGALINVCHGRTGRGAVGRVGLLMGAYMGMKIGRFNVDEDELVRDPTTGFILEAAPGEAGELLLPIVASRPETRFVGYTDEASTKKKLADDVFVKGDQYFRTGDLLSKDTSGYFYFVDRIGDTFRWKGENVSTTEVSEALTQVEGIFEANVYGVQVPGALDGRACMASIQCTGSKTDFLADKGLERVAASCGKLLPPYARPLFLRFPEQQLESTGTLKQVKTTLRKEGCDPSLMGGDLLFWWNPSAKSFQALEPATYPQLGELLTGGGPKPKL